jgi:stress responsive alpha/beta barrel protein
MKKSSRRQFISNSGKTALAGSSIIFAGTTSLNMPVKSTFVHHVYFWLKNPDSKEDKNKLTDGLKKLSKVKTIKFFHIGQPAGTSRDVIDSSYAVSWLVFFDTKEDQDSYQTDPIHLKFVEECSPVWTRVIVYDSVDIQ